MTAAYIISILSLIAAILAWVAKLRWSKEYREAKQAEVDALKAHLHFFTNFDIGQVDKWLKIERQNIRHEAHEVKEQLAAQKKNEEELIDWVVELVLAVESLIAFYIPSVEKNAIIDDLIKAPDLKRLVLRQLEKLGHEKIKFERARKKVVLDK